MNPDPGVQAALARAAAVLRDVDALLIGAGAGIGVDSGLPDFRGDHGFWKGRCGALARPNVLMFGDGAWVDARTEAQYARLEAWRAQTRRLAVIELGAGVDVPSVRWMCERQDAPLIRIDPRAPEVPSAAGIGIAAGALDALRGLRVLLI